MADDRGQIIQRRGLSWTRVYRMDWGDTVFGVLSPEDQRLTGASRWEWLLKGALAFRLTARRITVPIAFEVDTDTPPPPNIRLPQTGDVMFLVPDPEALLPDVREALVVMDDVPWCVDFSDKLTELPAEEQRRIAFVRILRDQRTRRDEVERMVKVIREGEWHPVAWAVQSDEEMSALIEMGVPIGEGPIPAVAAADEFPWGEANDNPFE